MHVNIDRTSPVPPSSPACWALEQSILVVEDPDLARAIAATLNVLVHHAASVPAAIEYIWLFRPSVVVLGGVRQDSLHAALEEENRTCTYVTRADLERSGNLNHVLQKLLYP
jgi:hypothetical protein